MPFGLNLQSDIEHSNRYRLNDPHNIDRWMCPQCGFIIDYQFDKEDVGWPTYKPEPGTVRNQWIDEKGEEQVEIYEPEEVKSYCPRCGLDFDDEAPIRIKISLFQRIEDISDLISQGEGRSLDFKLDLPDADGLGKIITSFANTAGGRILLGVDDDGEVKGFSGVDSPEGKDSFQKRIKGIVGNIQPKVDLRVDFVSGNNMTVVIMTVPKGNGPYLFKNIVYVRELESSRPASREEIIKLARALRNGD